MAPVDIIPRDRFSAVSRVAAPFGLRPNFVATELIFRMKREAARCAGAIRLLGRMPL